MAFWWQKKDVSRWFHKAYAELLCTVLTASCENGKWSFLDFTVQFQTLIHTVPLCAALSLSYIPEALPAEP